MQQLHNEIDKRRTFAIISHPDAGKTTLTEKLLLYGGAIRLAGSVKARKAARHATSDWMELEKQRGISVTSSVMQFEYEGFKINILDTPGHEDFSEDTYRTLVAADSAVMIIDGAKGVEKQTIKLFQVCKMRNIPIFTFINKMDRASKDPFELMAELENVLGIRSCPVNWPIGTDGDFKGIYHIDENFIELYEASTEHGAKKVNSKKGTVDDEAFTKILGEHYHEKLIEDIELLSEAGEKFDLERIRQGELTPIFFGSAMNNFGVEPFLERFLRYTSAPLARKTKDGKVVDPYSAFSGFIFKIQANMDPQHRDRIAFMRIASGEFDKGMSVTHVQAHKKIKLAQPTQFMAQDREIVEKAYAGDIVGLFDPGIFSLGDTLIDSKDEFEFEGIPIFAPEYFSRISAVDSLKRKQFLKGVEQLAKEGAIQVFKQNNIGIEELIVGVVGALQIDVLEFRLNNEYGVEIRINRLPFRHVRWIMGEYDLDNLSLTSTTVKAKDSSARNVLLFENEWSINWALDNNKGLILQDIAPRE